MASDLEDFRQRFGDSVQAQLVALNRSMDLFNELVRSVDQRYHDLQESDAELRRLILEQGEQLRDLRQRLGGEGH
jgi:uncharacterized membrane protein YccC